MMDWITFAFGYIQHQDAFSDMVVDEWVSTERLTPYIKDMQENWGGFEGLLTWLRLYDEDPQLASQYKQDFLSTDWDKGVSWFNDFDDLYTEEQWRADLLRGEEE